MAKQPYKMTKLSEIRPYDRNPRIIPQAAVDAVAKSIAAFGFRQPIVVDGHGVILAGHTRYRAAQQLGLAEVPVIWQTDITDIQARGYRIADNKTAEIAAWDRDALDAEVRELAESVDADLDALGLSGWELDRILRETDALQDFLESERHMGQAGAPGGGTQPSRTQEHPSLINGAQGDGVAPSDGQPMGSGPEVKSCSLTIFYAPSETPAVSEVLGISESIVERKKVFTVEELRKAKAMGQKGE